jgi:two-component system chemotaxis sensor kinase CheA
MRFRRVDADVERLALRLGKPKPAVVIEAGGVRLPARRFGSFWASIVHVVRNMLDHGIESPEARLRAGKSAAGRIILRATETADRVLVEFEDDGAGIDWKSIAARARAAGIRCATQHDLETALFASGVSTAAEVTEISGRGVGLSAVLERCRALGGSAHVSSTKGVGTRFVFAFPRGAGSSTLPSITPKTVFRAAPAQMAQ